MCPGSCAAGAAGGGVFEKIEADIKFFLMFLKNWHASCYIISANRGKKLKKRK